MLFFEFLERQNPFSIIKEEKDTSNIKKIKKLILMITHRPSYDKIADGVFKIGKRGVL